MGNLKSIPLSQAKPGNFALAGLVVALVSSIVVSAQAAEVANVDDARIIENAKTGKEWPSNGLDYGANRFSPLDQITTANVGKLGLAWSYPLDSIRGVEATPDRCRRRHVCHGAVEHRPRHQRQDRRKDLDFRFPIASRRGLQTVLRCRQPWRRGLQGQGLCRNARRALDRPRCGDRQSRSGASTQAPTATRPYTITGAPLVAKGQGFHRRRRRRIWRSRRRQRI